MKKLSNKVLIATTGAIMLTALFAGCASYPHSSEETISRIKQSPQFHDGKFKNEKEIQILNFGQMWDSTKEVIFNKHPLAIPKQNIPLNQLTSEDFAEIKEQPLRFVRLGHSTVLIEMSGKYWLTDPVFSERASPVQWMGPKRFHEVPVSQQDLPEIEAVIISHNHYDHLDHGTIQQLKDKVKHFVVPLGIGDTLRAWGVDDQKITELDWWENIQLGEVELVSTPAQHFSGRGISDSAKTLWSSWVIRNQQHSVFFSGDTGYFDGFKKIGDKYGPFDYAFMECGAYNEKWADIHMMPEDTLQAFIDIKGVNMIPVHNGTFDLSTHSWYDPMTQISQLAAEHNVSLLTPMMGQMVEHDEDTGLAVSSLALNQNWWQQLVKNAQSDPAIKALDQQDRPATENQVALHNH
jgi:L-ascorbate metabolism protein UlaG (beta-lactamase superfamily)